MLKQKASPESIMLLEKEQELIAQLAQILSRESAQPKLVTSNGEEIIIPESVCNILRQAVQAMASDEAVSIVRHNRELTTQQAADILNVSRPFLVKLLDEGAIPYIKVGSDRRIRFKDLIIYQEQRDRKRRKLLDQLIEMTEEAGLYEFIRGISCSASKTHIVWYNMIIFRKSQCLLKTSSVLRQRKLCNKH